MRNLGSGLGAILGSALRNADSSQHHNFQSDLKFVSRVVDFSLMAQSSSHRPDTHVYMEMYLQIFHWTKDIFLEFRTLQITRAEANRQDRDLRELSANQRANEARHNTAAKSRRQVDQERLERGNQLADLIQHENYFNFINMHYLRHFPSHVRHFGSISMYSTKIGELAHKEQINDCYRGSNKNEATRQILSQFGRQNALGMRL